MGYQEAYLAEIANIADTLAFEGAEIGRDTAVFEVCDTGERLIQEGANRRDGEAASSGLDMVNSL